MPELDKFLIQNSSAQNNVTGAGTAYTIEWDDVIIDPNSHLSDGVASLNGFHSVLVGGQIKLSGLSILNTRAVLSITTTNGDIPIFDGPIYEGTTASIISIGCLQYLNPNNDSPFEYTLKITVFGGLTDSVDVLADSQFWSIFV